MNTNLNVILLICACLAFNIGCKSSKSSSKYDFPSGMEEHIHGEFNAAKACIESTGTPIMRQPRSVKLTLIPGQKRFKNGWGWEYAPGKWAVGTTQTFNYKDFYINIGRNPNNANDLDRSTTRHEGGHVHLLCSYQIHDHPQKYRGCFETWKAASVKEVKCLTVLGDDGSVTIVDEVFPEDEVIE